MLTLIFCAQENFLTQALKSLRPNHKKILVTAVQEAQILFPLHESTAAFLKVLATPCVQEYPLRLSQ